MTLSARAVALGSAVLGVACSADEPRPPPPPIVGTSPDDPKSCSELFASGALEGKHFAIDGGRAACAADGLGCPLSPANQTAAACDAGTRGVAECVRLEWTLDCVPLGDAGP
jgi:hypothetical protein